MVYNACKFCLSVIPLWRLLCCIVADRDHDVRVLGLYVHATPPCRNGQPERVQLPGKVVNPPVAGTVLVLPMRIPPLLSVAVNQSVSQILEVRKHIKTENRTFGTCCSKHSQAKLYWHKLTWIMSETWAGLITGGREGAMMVRTVEPGYWAVAQQTMTSCRAECRFRLLAGSMFCYK